MPKENFKTKLVNGVEVALSPDEVDTLVENELAHNAKVADYLANHKYKDDRKNGTFDDSGKRLTDGYPQLAEQLDMLFRDIAANKVTTDGELYKALAKIKSDNPKPD
jgi:hypothetical protein